MTAATWRTSASPPITATVSARSSADGPACTSRSRTLLAIVAGAAFSTYDARGVRCFARSRASSGRS